MPLQKQLDELVLERADRSYCDNPVVLYQKIFEKVKDDVNQLRRRNNTSELSNKLGLAYFVLKAKASAWAARGKDELLSQIDVTTKKQKDLEYRDNSYIDIYLKYLLDEKKRAGY